MCNGFSTRTSQGGAVAILHPLCRHDGEKPDDVAANDDQIGKIVIQEECRADGERTGTIVFSFLPNKQSRQSFEHCRIEIHPDGDLVPSQTRDSIPALHTVTIRGAATAGIASVSDENSGLRLAVGDRGVIGRRLSMVDKRSGIRLAEGVIGWN
ncbi:hypothetical protein VTO42DRAFT_4159 [Malbranchea cinnamomea]